MPFPYANDDSRRVSLEQYAANFHGGILEAHANAFDPLVQQHQPPRQSNHGRTAVLPPDQAPPYQNPYWVSDQSSAPTTQVTVPRSSSHCKPTFSAVTLNHHTSIASPPSSTGRSDPEQPRQASPRRSPSAATNHNRADQVPASWQSNNRSTRASSRSGTYGVCCGKSYGTKFTFERHRRESRTCPYGTAGRKFVCYTCANTDHHHDREYATFQRQYYLGDSSTCQSTFSL
ncbi:hypothetical protein BFW01_g12269 [Lasiodiplodia theobromae]|nr:hypothetical protein BFW01_g12269 [Lasiodiplodia theobromae]